MTKEEKKALKEQRELERAKKIAEKKAKMKKEQKGFFEDFKKFITRGNVVDMAVGVAVAAAFTAIVTAFTKGFVTPLLALLSGDKTTAELKWIIRPEKVRYVDGVQTVVESEVAILYGAFLQAILDFLIIAFTLFIVMKIAGAIIKRTNRVMTELKKLTDAESEKQRLEAEMSAFALFAACLDKYSAIDALTDTPCIHECGAREDIMVPFEISSEQLVGLSEGASGEYISVPITVGKEDV